MPDNKPEKEILLDNQTVLLSETVIKLAAIERILKAAGLLTDEQLIEETKKLVAEISSVMASIAMKDQVEPAPDPQKSQN